MVAGGSAQSRADELRAEASQARDRAAALETEAGAWAAGADGERRVATLLGQLPAGWHAHHDRLLRPGRTQANLDHVVVGPSGVFLVDTKNWAGGTSVREGNLWQHTGSSSPKGRELDAVSRAAGEMERTLGLPVVPVIALAGGRSASFTRQRVRGVEIVPQDELVSWLLIQPATPDHVGAELLARRVAHTYPAASPEAVPPRGAVPLTVPEVIGPDGQGFPPVGRSSRDGTTRRSRRRLTDPPATGPTRRRRRRAGSWGSALVGLVILMAVSQVGPHVTARLMDSLDSGLPDSVASSADPTPSAASKECSSLTGVTIAKVTGARTVMEKPSSSHESCTWWLAKPRYNTQGADVMVETGRTVSVRLAASGTTTSRVDRFPGEVSAWLPQDTRLSSWRPGTRSSQPFRVYLRFTYPEGANESQARAVEAAAEKKVTRLAEALAVGLAKLRSS